MNHLRILLFFGCIASAFGAVNGNIPPIPGPPPAVQLPLDNAFNNLRTRANVQCVNDLFSAVGDLRTAIFIPMDINNIPNQNQFLTRLRAIRNSLNNTHRRMGPSIRNLQGLISNRIDLARIDQNVLTGLGRRATFNHPNFTINIRQTLSSITGRIFHIKRSLVGGGIDEEVQGVGSGTLVHFTQAHNNPPDIQQLVPGANQQLNAVLTCAHVLKSDDNSVIEVYFVPSDRLNLLFGLPTDLAIAGANPAANLADFSNFLRTNPYSFRIGQYNLWQRHLGPPGLQCAPNNSMGSTNPMYLDNEDMIVARIEHVPPQVLGVYNGPATVDFVKGGANVVAHAGGINDYFAIGYPGCDHYDVIFPPLANVFNQALLDVSPLFMTKASIAQQGALQVNNGEVSHNAPAAAGMSGGPLLTVLGNTINIFGVITRGNDNDETACNIEYKCYSLYIFELKDLNKMIKIFNLFKNISFLLLAFFCHSAWSGDSTDEHRRKAPRVEVHPNAHEDETEAQQVQVVQPDLMERARQAADRAEKRLGLNKNQRTDLK